jgi:hypothetical protein
LNFISCINFVTNGFVYAEVHHGMYGPPQAAIIVNQQLQEKLEPYSYHPASSYHTQTMEA